MLLATLPPFCFVLNVLRSICPKLPCPRRSVSTWSMRAPIQYVPIISCALILNLADAPSHAGTASDHSVAVSRDLLWAQGSGWKGCKLEGDKGANLNLPRRRHWCKVEVSNLCPLNAFSWMKMIIFWLKFHWNLFLSVQLIISQHLFRWLPEIIVTMFTYAHMRHSASMS